MSLESPLRIGVAGLGRAFTLMLPSFALDSRVRLVAACDPREAARIRFTQDFHAPAYEDIEALARDPQVEAIYVATPHQFHAAHACIAARNGKHLLVEKPMALTLSECDAMIAACRAAGVQMIVGHSHAFDTPYLKARELIASGRFGRARMIHALNYTDFLYRPRRPEELSTEAGGGVVFSQAAHQIDVVRMLVLAEVRRVRAVTGAWDPQRPTEGAYALLLWFDDGTFASLGYSGYGRFDSDAWCDWVGEMGQPKHATAHGLARRRLRGLGGAAEEARLKADRGYGGPAYEAGELRPPSHHQHFGPVVVSCEHADLRPVPDGLWIYADAHRTHLPLPPPPVPRIEVIDELHAALRRGVPPLHDGAWARDTLAVCLALLQSAREGRDVELS